MSSSPHPRAPSAASSADPALLRPPAQPVVGTPLALTDYERTMNWMDAVVAAREKAIVTAAAVHLVMVSREDEATRAAVGDPRVLAVPDGQPLVWALKALGQRDASRVYGPDLMARYLERSTRTGVRHYLYGGTNQGALVQLVNELRRRYPGLQIVGGYSPPFRALTADEEDFVVEDIRRCQADVVWVGTGQPKQEQWMARYRDRLDAPVLVGVGAAFDFHAGLKSQAPAWMQASGLEWAYRLAQEPRRLWRRYLLYNPLFIGAFARQWARQRRA
ncbi:MAG TPA: WecB/TagA/CpsF family glycosyltransferase [Capillimicrobium sp.]|jgi:N-acetylglucosaminyldiphosphoundecaprenol N-acetyl-beta-D-mannosaminyltransferase